MSVLGVGPGRSVLLLAAAGSVALPTRVTVVQNDRCTSATSRCSGSRVGSFGQDAGSSYPSEATP